MVIGDILLDCRIVLLPSCIHIYIYMYIHIYIYIYIYSDGFISCLWKVVDLFTDLLKYRIYLYVKTCIYTYIIIYTYTWDWSFLKTPQIIQVTRPRLSIETYGFEGTHNGHISINLCIHMCIYIYVYMSRRLYLVHNVVDRVFLPRSPVP